MTLIVTAASKNCVIQVADRLLTDRYGKPVKISTKSIILRFHQGTLAISFTGLANIGKIDMGFWLAEKIKAINPQSKSFPEIVEFLRQVLSEAGERNKYLKEIGLSLVIAGLGTYKDDARGIAIARVSNVEVPAPKSNIAVPINPRTSEFKKIFLNGNFDTYVDLSGAVGYDINMNSIRKQIEKKLRLKKSPSQMISLIQSVVSMFHAIRRDSRYEHLIGKDYNVACVHDDFEYSFYIVSNNKIIREAGRKIEPD